MWGSEVFSCQVEGAGFAKVIATRDHSERKEDKGFSVAKGCE